MNNIDLIVRMIEVMKLWGVKAPIVQEAEEYVKAETYFDGSNSERMQAADDAFANADLPQLESSSCWKIDGNIWSCRVYWTPDNPNDDSVLGSFTVEFEPNSSKIVSTTWQ